MRFINYVIEDDYISYITQWSIQKQLGHDIREVFDKNINIQSRKGGMDFGTKFVVSGDWYVFDAKEDPLKSGYFGVMFYKRGDVGDDMFSLKRDKKYIGDVVAGVFRSIRRLEQEKIVDGIMFQSDIPDLIKFYDKLTPHIEGKFDYSLEHRRVYGDTVQWVYNKK